LVKVKNHIQVQFHEEDILNLPRLISAAAQVEQAFPGTRLIEDTLALSSELSQVGRFVDEPGATVQLDLNRRWVYGAEESRHTGGMRCSEDAMLEIDALTQQAAFYRST